MSPNTKSGDYPFLNRKTMLGVSVVICSHNGAARLPATLKHLSLQNVPPDLPWEIVVVDNASSDQTGHVARSNWPIYAQKPLRVVYEGELGLTQARRRAFAEAQYELVSFIDDDNWVESNWVRVVANVMGRYADVGACGGRIQAQYEVPPPHWVEKCQSYYAVGNQYERGGDITWERGYLWGAGLTVRKSAYTALVADGFRFRLNDRTGLGLMSGGDAELCLALRLAGWKLWYEPSLTMRHFIHSSRLEWKYLKRVAQGFGGAAAVLNAYATVRQEGQNGMMLWMRSNWLCQSLITVLRIFTAFRRALIGLPTWEGNEAVLEIIYRRETLLQFLRIRTRYDSLCRQIQKDFKTYRASVSKSLLNPETY